MFNRQKLIASSSASEVDFVRLCEDIVGKIEEVLKRRNVLNKRQCRSLALKLSLRIANIRVVVECCEKHKPAFVPLLAALYRYYEKADVLVTQCGDEDWCAAAVFQRGNSASFVDIINHIKAVGMEVFNRGRCYARLRNLTMHQLHFGLEKYFEIHDEYFESLDEYKYGVKDEDEELRTRLEVLASERRNSKFRIFGFLATEQEDLKQYLARHLLKKYKIQSGLRNPLSSLEDLKGHMWEKDDEPTRTWGESQFLGVGSGASGVCKTSWLGVPCAKKVFLGEASKTIFMKEASIMARLKHPCIVDFICCGDGERKGDRFIAMELMEKSLFDLIEEQKGVHFALDVALDIILQIANGVKYLHEQGVAHRDLKPHNVVVKTLRSPYREDYYCVKLVDFGTCKIEVEVAKSNTMSYRGVGTTCYRAPEAHPSAHPEGLGKVEWFKADAYSFAMTCAHVLTLSQPYENLESLSKLYTEILKGERPMLPRVCPKGLVHLVEECWSTNRNERPEFSNIHHRLKDIVFNNMRVHFPNHKNEEEQVEEESYCTAQDISLSYEGKSSLKESIAEHSWGVRHQENLLDEIDEELEVALVRVAHPKEEGTRYGILRPVRTYRDVIFVLFCFSRFTVNQKPQLPDDHYSFRTSPKTTFTEDEIRRQSPELLEIEDMHSQIPQMLPRFNGQGGEVPFSPYKLLERMERTELQERMELFGLPEDEYLEETKPVENNKARVGVVEAQGGSSLGYLHPQAYSSQESAA